MSNAGSTNSTNSEAVSSRVWYQFPLGKVSRFGVLRTACRPSEDARALEDEPGLLPEMLDRLQRGDEVEGVSAKPVWTRLPRTRLICG